MNKKQNQYNILISRIKYLILHVKQNVMNTKLTLNLDKDIIESAKDYAKNNHTSLSKLIENYLNSLIIKEDKKVKISPLVNSLTGIIPYESEEDYKINYSEYLSKKYL